VKLVYEGEGLIGNTTICAAVLHIWSESMTLQNEKKKINAGFKFIIGCDEVGRGCLAGPVVAGAVAFDLVTMNDKRLKTSEIKDSKLLTASKRQQLSDNIKTFSSAWSVAAVSSVIVDKINIHNASLLAMKKAAEKLSSKLTEVYLFVDGRFMIPGVQCDQESVINGDNKILCIAAASIIAKVYRDELMNKLDKQYPIYNFRQHKGYATLFHRTIVLKNGLTPIHRKSFCKQLSI
jgi:ribonuclease HII